MGVWRSGSACRLQRRTRTCFPQFSDQQEQPFVQVSPEYIVSSKWQRMASSGIAWTEFRMGFRPGIHQSSRRFSRMCRHKPVLLNWGAVGSRAFRRWPPTGRAPPRNPGDGSKVTKGNGSSWIFGPCLTCANVLRRVQHPGFSLVGWSVPRRDRETSSRLHWCGLRPSRTAVPAGGGASCPGCSAAARISTPSTRRGPGREQ
jgi:hypothetical protein